MPIAIRMIHHSCLMMKMASGRTVRSSRSATVALPAFASGLVLPNIPFAINMAKGIKEKAATADTYNAEAIIPNHPIRWLSGVSMNSNAGRAMETAPASRYDAAKAAMNFARLLPALAV